MATSEFGSSLEITGSVVFPIGAESVRSVFQEVLEKKIPLEEIIIQSEIGVYDQFKQENSHALDYLDSYRGEFDEKETGSLFLGYLLFYSSLKKRNGNMPMGELNEDFIESYEDKNMQRTGVAYLDFLQLDDEKYRSGIPDINLNKNNQLLHEDLFAKVSLLRMTDGEAYYAISDGLKDHKDERYIDEYILAGFAQAYFLFQEGLSDLYNYTPPRYIEA